MAIEGGMSCVKYLLFCFNLLFAITGLIIIVAAAIAQIKSHPYIDLTDEDFFTYAPIILIIVGVIIFVVAFFGCCGAVKENHCMIVTFSVFLLLIFVAELGVGIAGYMKRQDLETSITRSLNESIKNYDTHKSTIDMLQIDLQCCGVKGPGDWALNNVSIPNSCCAANEMKGTKVVDCTVNSGTLHKEGCLDKLVALLKHSALMLGGVGLGIAFIQLLGVIFACCLARSIRSQYETV